MNQIDTRAAADLLRGADNIVILCHQKPDGDTLGSAFALLYALEALGKTARVESPDGFPERFSFLYGNYAPKAFERRYVVSVDVANPSLLGDLQAAYADCIDLCVDHHRSNTVAARHSWIDAGSAACALMIYELVGALGAPIDGRIADALYTGITTDTGCFLYDTVDADTHRIAADLIDLGARHGEINRLMFESMSKGRVALDRAVIESLEYHFDGRCALITIPEGLTEQLGLSEGELDGVSALPRKIEGVIAGITLREREGDICRVSLRTTGGLDASAICNQFGGGGHKNAAGCTIEAPPAEAKRRIIEAVGRAIAAL